MLLYPYYWMRCIFVSYIMFKIRLDFKCLKLYCKNDLYIYFAKCREL